jgi:hypothetical protein
MATQTISSLGKAAQADDSERWTERRALVLWLCGSVGGWALILGLIYVGRTLF